MTEKILPEYCPRCSGRMLFDKSTPGDLACFNCGHVTYAQAPVLLMPGEMINVRRASHAGVSLS